MPEQEPIEGEPLREQCLRDHFRVLLDPYKLGENANYLKTKATFDLLEPSSIPEEDRKCCICYETFDQHYKPSKQAKSRIFGRENRRRKNEQEEQHFAVQAPCRGQHIMGWSCIVHWLEESQGKYGCPVCRDTLVPLPTREGLREKSFEYYRSQKPAQSPYTYSDLKRLCAELYWSLDPSPGVYVPVKWIEECRKCAQSLATAIRESLHGFVSVEWAKDKRSQRPRLLDGLRKVLKLEKQRPVYIFPAFQEESLALPTRYWSRQELNRKNGELLEDLHDLICLWIQKHPFLFGPREDTDRGCPAYRVMHRSR